MSVPCVQVSPTKTSSFGHCLSHICALLHLFVVERVEDSASLYGSSIQKHHVCVLVKSAVSTNRTVCFVLGRTDRQTDNSIAVVSYCIDCCLFCFLQEEGKVSVSAKCSDSSFISHLLTELKTEL